MESSFWFLHRFITDLFFCCYTVSVNRNKQIHTGKRRMPAVNRPAFRTCLGQLLRLADLY